MAEHWSIILQLIILFNSNISHSSHVNVKWHNSESYDDLLFSSKEFNKKHQKPYETLRTDYEADHFKQFFIKNETAQIDKINKKVVDIDEFSSPFVLNKNKKRPKQVSEENIDAREETKVKGLSALRQGRPLTGQVPLSSYNWTVWCKLQPNGFACVQGEQLEKKYYYDIKLRTCLTYEFGSCIDNFNKFAHEKSCLDICEGRGPAELSEKGLAANVLCRLQPAFGSCQDYFPMFYYDMTERDCKGFAYSGCDGNANRFKTIEACRDMCDETMSKARF